MIRYRIHFSLLPGHIGSTLVGLGNLLTNPFFYSCFIVWMDNILWFFRINFVKQFGKQNQIF